MNRCRTLAQVLAAEQQGSLGWTDRLRLRLHLFMCPPCRRYAEQIRALGDAACDMIRACDPEAQEMARIEASILEGCGLADEAVTRNAPKELG